MEVYIHPKNYRKIDNKGLYVTVFNKQGKYVARFFIGTGTVRWYKRNAKRPTKILTWNDFISLLENK